MRIPGNLSSPWDKAQSHSDPSSWTSVVEHIWNPTIQGVETGEMLQIQSQGVYMSTPR